MMLAQKKLSTTSHTIFIREPAQPVWAVNSSNYGVSTLTTC